MRRAEEEPRRRSPHEANNGAEASDLESLILRAAISIGHESAAVSDGEAVAHTQGAPPISNGIAWCL